MVNFLGTVIYNIDDGRVSCTNYSNTTPSTRVKLFSPHPTVPEMDTSLGSFTLSRLNQEETAFDQINHYNEIEMVIKNLHRNKS